MKKLPRNLRLEAGNARRQFLKIAGCGALGFMAGGFQPLLGQSAAGQHGDSISKTGFVPDLDISLVSKPGEVVMFPGPATQIWQYQAKVIKGDKNRVVNLPRSYLGPIIKAQQGEKLRIRFTNSISIGYNYSISALLKNNAVLV
jgi:FtsP/CotA-like multicopper oxidase with cupredoxin domain